MIMTVMIMIIMIIMIIIIIIIIITLLLLLLLIIILPEELPDADAVVWPGNCHALPTSGLDRALTGWLGADTLERARSRILEEFGEEGAPAGTAYSIDLGGDGVCASPRRPRRAIFTVAFPRTCDSPREAMAAMLRALVAVEGGAEL